MAKLKPVLPIVDALSALEGDLPDELTALEQARIEKWRQAASKAQETGKMANTLAKALAMRFAKRWRFIDFLGPKGRESAGIVDILAVRKWGKDPGVKGLKKLDLFEFQIIQVKGGSAPLPTKDEINRLRLVQKRYGAKRVILFEWVKDKRAMFSELGKDKWQESTAKALFGPKS
jgi:hypothetical protein